MIARLKRWVTTPEVIGDPECPIMFRWTLLDGGRTGLKFMLHRFPPLADDRDIHDHPRSFVTLVLRGYYDDLVPCSVCHGARHVPIPGAGPNTYGACPGCSNGIVKGDGLVLNERMRPGMVRLRRAEHAHRTRVGPRGCWTIVVMGPLRREWGFWRGGKFWHWREYGAVFGFGMRCDNEGERDA